MFKKYILKNGLRIVLCPMPRSLATTFLVLVEAGSKYETKEINGVSHFLEHMCFKGTKKRPTALAIASELESLGAIYNAFTGHEYTGYYAKVGVDKINSALDIISDMYLDPLFDEKEIEKEKGVIVEEINMYEDLPQKKVVEIFMKLLYGDQPAGWDIAGPRDTVRGMSRKDIVDYRNKHYVPSATTVVVSGAFKEKEMLKKLNKIFAGVQSGGGMSKKKVLESQSAPAVALYSKQLDQTHLILGFRAFDMFDKRRYALDVLCDILGGGMSSRLFQKIRGEMGAAYYISCGNSLLTDHGFVSISAGVDNIRVSEVIKEILNEIERIKAQPVSKEELQKTKNHIMGRLMIGLETSDSIAEFYGEQEIFREKILTPEQVIRKIRSVKVSDVQALAKEIFQNDRLNLAVVGPFKDDSDLKKNLTL
ncbi:MAG: insulinase family protein [Patescibacteria group bacterium]|nr:insulinase family protein [Patescibacteria group bacterium]